MIGEVMGIVEKFRQMLKGLVMYVRIANPKYT